MVHRHLKGSLAPPGSVSPWCKSGELSGLLTSTHLVSVSIAQEAGFLPSEKKDKEKKEKKKGKKTSAKDPESTQKKKKKKVRLSSGSSRARNSNTSHSNAQTWPCHLPVSSFNGPCEEEQGRVTGETDMGRKLGRFCPASRGEERYEQVPDLPGLARKGCSLKKQPSAS